LGWTPGCSLVFHGAGPVHDVVKLEGEDAFGLDVVTKLDNQSWRNTWKMKVFILFLSTTGTTFPRLAHNWRELAIIFQTTFYFLFFPKSGLENVLFWGVSWNGILEHVVSIGSFCLNAWKVFWVWGVLPFCNVHFVLARLAKLGKTQISDG
jgi:hypothetical protein